MWGSCRSTQQQQEEGVQLCSQLFKPVLTVLWSSVGERDCLAHTPPSPPIHAQSLTDCLSCIKSWQQLSSQTPLLLVMFSYTCTKQLRCFLIHYRCIRCLWTTGAQKFSSIENFCRICTVTYLWTDKHKHKCSVNKQAVVVTFNHTWYGWVKECRSGAISWILNDIKAKRSWMVCLVRRMKWIIFSTGGRHRKRSDQVMWSDERTLLVLDDYRSCKIAKHKTGGWTLIKYSL